jgi:AraC family transcriptional activator FtrA
MLVALAVTENVPIFELAVPTEVFGIDRPELADPWYKFRLCGLDSGRTRVANGFSIETPFGLDGLRDADTIVVPACANVHELPPPALVDALRDAADRGTRIAAICSGAFVLAAAGLLDGRRATTHWMHADELGRRYPDVHVDASVLYVQDGGIFTSAGTAAGLDLCLELVRQDHGSAVANRLARRLVVPPQRAGGQAQFVETPMVETGDDFADLLDWVMARLDRPLTVTDLAAAGNMSPRTLARRFDKGLGTSPVQWLLAQRVRRAQELLEMTDESVERVADLVGFRPATLREHFLKAVGVPPAAYRRTFRATETAASTV